MITIRVKKIKDFFSTWNWNDNMHYLSLGEDDETTVEEV
jgi:hypothetical protein